ncbi:MAG TPA: hypothetical protein VGW78_01700 [Candidatus Babeliales bacterium]|jgi:hypothetical protein|nr:hypothetical protein [Candidatus Babeliales bacterium]
MNNEIIGLYDIYSVYHIPFWQQEWVIQAIAFSLSGILCIGALAIAYIFYKKYQYIVYTDPWLLYLKNLELLYPKKVMTNAEIAFFYDKLTNLLKKYVYIQYSIAHYHVSDQEMHIKIQESHNALLHFLLPIFEHSITIKFARMNADIAQVHTDYNIARDFIISTQSFINNKRESV